MLSEIICKAYITSVNFFYSKSFETEVKNKFN